MSTVKKQTAFYEVGKEADKIDVRVSYHIIKLFSDGLYSSPNKAVEELVSNSWDAGAEHVHIIVPPDPESVDGQIVVIDDGTGMDGDGLRQHWLLGDSPKRLETTVIPKGRKAIGKFGIGKLATYVLAHRLTHITKCGDTYYSTTMDYHRIDAGAGDATKERTVQLPLRKLTESEAEKAVAAWTDGTKPGYKALKLFGSKSAESWTVAVMSELKPMAKQLRLSRLHWILETAMPLGDDFKLYLNGEKIESSKLKEKRVGTWWLGKDLGTEDVPLPKPAPEDIELRKDTSEPKDSPLRFGIFHPKIGRVTGFVEAFVDELGGKSDKWAQSNGFSVYVRGRRINVDDPGFGIDRNLLQHGTFSRFRMVVHMDGLDDELRSSRETVREGEILDIARKILQSGFNFARSQLTDHANKSSPGAAVSARVADSPASLTSRPIYSVIVEALDGKATPRYIHVPKNLSKDKREELLELFEKPDDEAFKLVEKTELTALNPDDGITLYDVSTRVLKINTMHPFVAHFLNEYQSTTRSLPLELLAMSEVLLEAHLYQQYADEDSVKSVLTRRDQLLRHLSKTSGRKNAFMVARDLVEAARDESELERELVNAFSSIGFEAVPLGGPGKPDGIATANLSSTGQQQRSYSVSLEAKSKESADGKVSAKTVGISAIVRQRDDFSCDHAVVVGPDFPSSNEGKTALEKEIADSKSDSARKDQPPKTITLIRVKDLARLVKLVPQKRIGLTKFRELFTKCRMPEESAKWVDSIEALTVTQPPYRKILDAIAALQQRQPDAVVKYSALRPELHHTKNVDMTEDELRNTCHAIMQLASSSYFNATADSVELNQKPERVLEIIGAEIDVALEKTEKSGHKKK
jgi:hypothetical protein